MAGREDVDRRDDTVVQVARLVAAHPVLAEDLVLRGGVALQHFVLPEPTRRCTGLEYARLHATPIGPVLDALRTVAADAGLRIRTEVRARPRVYLAAGSPVSDGSSPSSRPHRIRVDLETRELHPCLPVRTAPVPTYATEELVALVLREVYRRSRGRDLLDLWSALTAVEVDDRLVVDAFRAACASGDLGRVGRGAMVARLHRHLARPGYRDDVDGWRLGAARAFTAEAAVELTTARILVRLPA